MMRGDYWCENLGSLPCARHAAHFGKKRMSAVPFNVRKESR